MKARKIALLLGAVISILILSCQNRPQEPDVIASSDGFNLVQGQQDVALNNNISFKINLKGGTFNAIETTEDLTSWLVGKDVPSGLELNAASAISANATSGYFVISGTPATSKIGNVKIQIPASKVTNRVNAVTVETPHMQYRIVDNKTPYAKFVDASSVSNITWDGNAYSLTSYSVKLTNAFLQNVESGADISSWILLYEFLPDDVSSTATTGALGKGYTFEELGWGATISYENSEVISEFKVEPTIHSLKAGRFVILLQIPRQNLKTNTEFNDKYLYVMENSSVVALQNGVLGEVDSPITIEGKEEGVSVNAEFEIILKDSSINSYISFKQSAAESDISSWFSPTVKGLTYMLESIDVNNSRNARVKISGIPTALSEEHFSIKVPKDTFSTWFNGTATEMIIDTKGSKYEITAVSPESWAYHIYDIASFCR